MKKMKEKHEKVMEEKNLELQEYKDEEKLNRKGNPGKNGKMVDKQK